MGEESRRDFLKLTLGVWGIVCALPVVGMVLQYLTPARSTEVTKETVLVGSTEDVAEGNAKIVKVNKDPVILVHMQTGQFKAFSARCTHLGCIVQYREAPQPLFVCNCHGSQYDMNGKNVAGPAPRPLAPYRVRLNGTSIYLTSS